MGTSRDPVESALTAVGLDSEIEAIRCTLLEIRPMIEALHALLPDALDPYAELFAGAIGALVIFVLGWIASKWVAFLVVRALRRANVDEALARFLSGIAKYAVLAAAVVTALTQVGVAATSFVALIGAAGLAVGLALQGNLSHFASGVMILFFRPFTIGDRVTISGLTGNVEDIGLFATTLKTPLNETIIIPNSKITEDSIVNFTSAGLYRAVIGVGVAYGTKFQEAERVAIEAASGVQGVMVDNGIDVVFNDFGASSVDLLVRTWCEADEAAAVRHRMRIAVYDAFDAAGIEIPFDQIVLHKAAE